METQLTAKDRAQAQVPLAEQDANGRRQQGQQDLQDGQVGADHNRVASACSSAAF